MRLASRSQATFEPGLVEYAARDLLDRAFRGIDERKVIAPEDRLGRAHFVVDLRRRRVLAVRPALVAYLLETLGRNRQSVQLALMPRECRRKTARLELL